VISCARFDELHLQSIDVPLDGVARAEFDGHLATCRACVDRLRKYVATQESLRELGRAEALETPPPMPEALIARILESRRATRGRAQQSG
jgi:anti-sigma factor RsiW